MVEATASYEWLIKLIEPPADRVVLAHPKKLRIIAESTRKSDKLDAQVLAEFLALDMIPEAYRPGPRQRAHRVLVRHRHYLRGRLTSVRNKMRRILSDYNADRADLFTRVGLAYLAKAEVSPADRFVLDQLRAEWDAYTGQLEAADKRLREFAAEATTREAEDRAVLQTIPGVGVVTVDVVVSELGDPGAPGSIRLCQEGVCLCGAGPRWAGIRRASQAVAYYQGGIATPALGVGGGILAVGVSDESVAKHLRGVGQATRQETGDRRGGPATVVRHGFDAADRAQVSSGDGVIDQPAW